MASANALGDSRSYCSARLVAEHLQAMPPLLVLAGCAHAPIAAGTLAHQLGDLETARQLGVLIDLGERTGGGDGAVLPQLDQLGRLDAHTVRLAGLRQGAIRLESAAQDRQHRVLDADPAGPAPDQETRDRDPGRFPSGR